VAEVSINKVVPGNTLSRDVLLSGGALLAKAGTVVTQRHIEQMTKRGIRTLHIETGAGEAKSSEVSDLDYHQRCERLEAMFADVVDAPHMSAVKEAARTRLRHKRPWE